MANHRIKAVLILLLFPSVLVASPPQQREPIKFSPRELRHDLDVAIRTLQQVHPALYAHVSKAEFDGTVAEIRGQIDRSMTSVQFFRAIAPLFAKVRCYHTWLQPSNQDLLALENGTGVLALDVIVRPHGVFVRKNLQEDPNIPAGSRIVGINGHSMDSAVKDLLKNYPLSLDGVGMSPRYAKLSRPGYFSRAYALFFDDSPPSELAIVIPGTEALRKVRVIPMKASELLKRLQPDKPQFTLNFDPSASTAILTIRSFARNDQFDRFLQDTFRTLRERHTPNLVLDLRNNGGGEDLYGVLLFSYLAKAPFRYYATLEANSDHFEAARGDSNFPTEAFRKRMEPMANGRFQVRTSAHLGLGLHQPNALHFEGTVFCLVNGLTGSAATEFAAIAHTTGRVLFVGEETGGGYAMDSSGPSVEVELPNTKVRVTVPSVQYKMALSRDAFPNHGLVPATNVESTVEDMVSGNDRQLHYTLELIHERSANHEKTVEAMVR